MKPMDSAKNRGRKPLFPIPVFDLTPRHRGSGMTDEQWAAYVRGRADYARQLGIYLATFQALCTWHGFHRKCRLAVCRRQGRCAGRRAEHDWSFQLRPVIPPCVPLDLEVVERLREEIREMSDLRGRG